jgi:hypothetical protein
MMSSWWGQWGVVKLYDGFVIRLFVRAMGVIFYLTAENKKAMVF